MASEKPKRKSKLDPFKKDILTLKNEGYSEASIVKYLAMNGVSVTQRAVNKFIHANSDYNVESVPVEEPVKKHHEEKKVSKSASVSTPRKFDWQTPVDEKDII